MLHAAVCHNVPNGLSVRFLSILDTIGHNGQDQLSKRLRICDLIHITDLEEIEDSVCKRFAAAIFNHVKSCAHGHIYLSID